MLSQLKSIISGWKKRLHRELKSSFSDVHFAIAQNQLKSILGGIFGYFAVLYSKRAEALVQDNVVVRNSVVITELPRCGDLYCCFQELPIASDSIDLVVLPEIIQNSHYPHQILREVERVLIPEGHVILILENPFSWISIKKRLIAGLIQNKDNPSLFGKSRISDWFRLLGLKISNEIPISPVADAIAKSHSPEWVKQSANWLSRYFAGYYILVAKKKVSTLIPIRPSWRSNRKLVSPRFAENSVNSQVDDYLKKLK